MGWKWAFWGRFDKKLRNFAKFDRRLLWSSMPLLSLFYGSSTKRAGKGYFGGIIKYGVPGISPVPFGLTFD
jgi:hypothetical protein